MDFDVGDRVDRYVVEKRLGEGGMAVVYRVRHRQLRSLHALKVLKLTSRGVRRRLLLEGRAQAALRHPCVVAVTDVLELDDQVALVLEYVNGPCLQEFLEQESPPIDVRLQLFQRVLVGVAAAHSAGLVHRDLKLQNVLLARTNLGLQPKVADFGLVKTERVGPGGTRSGALLGTPEYMSPEQVMDSAAVDQRSDVWSLGVMLYAILAGTLPFQAESQLELFQIVCSGAHVPLREARPDLPVYLSDAIEDALRVEPSERLPSVPALLARLFPGSDHLVSYDMEIGALGVDMSFSTAPVPIHQALPTTPVALDPRGTRGVPNVSVFQVATSWLGITQLDSGADEQPTPPAPASAPPRRRTGDARPAPGAGSYPPVGVAHDLRPVLRLVATVGIFTTAVALSRLLFPAAAPREVVVAGVADGTPIALRSGGELLPLDGFRARLPDGPVEVVWAVGAACDRPGSNGCVRGTWVAPPTGGTHVLEIRGTARSTSAGGP